MTTVKVPARRSVFVSTPDGVLYSIPLKRNLGILLFLPVWVVLWSSGEVGKFNDMMSKPGDHVFDIIWSFIWVGGLVTALYMWIATGIGREVITITPRALTIQRRVFGFEPKREYDRAAIHSFRVSPPPQEETGRRRSINLFQGGVITFDYGAATVRFGAGIDEAEGKMIVEELKARCHFAE